MKPTARVLGRCRILAGLMFVAGAACPAVSGVQATEGLAMLLVAALNRSGQAASAPLPEAVANAARESLPGSTVSGFRSEIEDGYRFYTVALSRAAETATVTAAPDGSLGEVQSRVPVDSLPDADQQRICAATHGGEVRRVERHIRVGRAQRGTFVRMSEPSACYVVTYVRPGHHRVSCLRLPSVPAAADAAGLDVAAHSLPAGHN